MSLSTSDAPPSSPKPPTLPFSSPFSHASEFKDFTKRIRPYMRTSVMQDLERDMQDSGHDPAVYWPKGVLEWVWSHPGRYEEVRRVARRCIRE